MKRILAMALTLMLALSLCVGFATAEGQTIKGWGAFNFNDQTGITSYSQQYSMAGSSLPPGHYGGMGDRF